MFLKKGDELKWEWQEKEWRLEFLWKEWNTAILEKQDIEETLLGIFIHPRMIENKRISISEKKYKLN